MDVLMEVKVSEPSDFGTMVDRFPIDVRDQVAERAVGVCVVRSTMPPSFPAMGDRLPSRSGFLGW
jgi:hypothetical protein